MQRHRLPLLGLSILAFAGSLAAQAKKVINTRELLAQPTFGAYQLSPDGRRVMFTRTDRDPKDWAATSHIWLHELDGGRTYQLTNSTRGESSPRFLPDGRVAFLSNRENRNAWWVIAPTGGEATRLVEGDSLPPNASFSHDGQRLVYTEATERPDKKEWDEKVKRKDDGYYAEKKLTYTHVWVYDMATRTKKQITKGEFDHNGPAFSPDGKWVVYTSNRSNLTVRDANWSNNSDLYLVSADGGEPRQLTTNLGPDNAARFSPDGQWIAYSSSDRRNSSADQSDVKVISVQGGEPRNLTADLDYSVGDI
ncbi:MAG: PD40 domain-containing protein, partial [Gemmatimonadetes bacterium]|nr:PD40 domain-containing protein [Gemmatimonadota bacterium]